MEAWKDIQGYEGRYLVSSLGNVISNARGGRRPLTQFLSKKGYRVVNLTTNGLCRRLLVHRLVAQAFIPNPDNRPMVNHKNGDKTDNCLRNLEWATHAENVEHAVTNKLYAHGNRMSVVMIVDGVEKGRFNSQHEAAQALGICQSEISRVCAGKRPHVRGFKFKREYK